MLLRDHENNTRQPVASATPAASASLTGLSCKLASRIADFVSDCKPFLGQPDRAGTLAHNMAVRGRTCPRGRAKPSPGGGAAKRRGAARPRGQAAGFHSSSRREDVVHEQGGERLARRTPVEALERPVVEEVVYSAHLLVEDGVEVASLGENLADDPVAASVGWESRSVFATEPLANQNAPQRGVSCPDVGSGATRGHKSAGRGSLWLPAGALHGGRQASLPPPRKAPSRMLRIPRPATRKRAFGPTQKATKRPFGPRFSPFPIPRSPFPFCAVAVQTRRFVSPRSGAFVSFGSGGDAWHRRRGRGRGPCLHGDAPSPRRWPPAAARRDKGFRGSREAQKASEASCKSCRTLYTENGEGIYVRDCGFPRSLLRASGVLTSFGRTRNRKVSCASRADVLRSIAIPLIA